jgi:hypothetical protein
VEPGARRCRPQRSGAAHQQPHTEIVLEPLDLTCQRRLCDSLSAGARRDRALLGHGYERCERGEAEPLFDIMWIICPSWQWTRPEPSFEGAICVTMTGRVQRRAQGTSSRVRLFRGDLRRVGFEGID